jgi:hypothetical protein
VLEDIKETLIKGLASTTYEHRSTEVKEKLDRTDEIYRRLLEGESDAYMVLLTKHFPELDIEKIIVDAIIKANNEVNGEAVIEDYKLAA